MTDKPRPLQDFVSEAQETVESLSKDLLRLGDAGGDPDPELVNRVFRAAHSIKGLAGMFGQATIATLAHACEDLLDDVRMGRVQLSPEVLDLLMEVVETFSRLLADAASGRTEPANAAAAESLAARIAARRAGQSAAGPDPLEAAGLDPAVRGVLTEYEEHRLRENLKRGVTLLRVRAAFDLADFDKGLSEVNSRLKPLGEVISTLPSAEGSSGGIAFDLLYGTRSPAGAVSAALTGLPAEVHPVGPVPGTPRPPPAPSPEPRRAEHGHLGEPEPSLRSVTQTVRVDIAKLDRLMNIVGELVIAKAGLQRCAEQVRADNFSSAQEMGAEMLRETHVLDRKLDELQKGILEVRMVPLEQVFDKLARMVRKIAREEHKEIDLHIVGGDVELDKLIVEDLSDPLMHLIRNSIDHGVESPEGREKAGKSRRGNITLAARQKGNHVVIEVADDGAGIDDDAVRKKAVETGLTTPAAARELTRRDVLNFVFLPGFSTASKVSELSGRGVGLDVVKTNIANLSGIIDLQSEQGKGTTLTITLPVMLAIIRALIVQAAGRVYAVPLNSVLEILEVKPGEVRTIERREVVDVRGSTLPLVRLARLFQLAGPEPRGAFFVVVVGLAQERLGIAVDVLVAQQDVVVKSLGRLLANIRGIAGATDLGSRRTVLVLDVGAIIEEVLAGERARFDAAG